MDESRPGQSNYRFGDIEVDARHYRVLRGGIELPLEPKAYAVLLELLRRSGDVIERDALLDAVWGHRHVTPAVLNRIVAILRRELGDDADHPRLIRTVHGVGYAFIGRLEADLAEVATMPAHSEASASVLAPAQAPTRMLAQASAPARMHAGTRTRDVAIAALVLAALLGFYFWTQSWRPAAPVAASATATSPPPMPAPHVAPTLVVLPLRALGDAHDETVLAEGLSEELTTRLSRIAGLGMISATSAAIAQSRQFDPAQLAEHLKATHALEGSLRETDGQLRINLRLSELPAGKLIWTQAYDRPFAKLETLQNDVAEAIAAALALQSGAAASTREARDIDPALWLRVHEAQALIRLTGPTQEKNMKAEAMMRAVVAEHPDFAPAHGFLSIVLQIQGKNAEATREAQDALKLDPNDTDARWVFYVDAMREGDWERGLAMLRSEIRLEEDVKLRPNPGLPRAFYGANLASLGYVEEGLRETTAALQTDPLGYFASWKHALVLDAAGRHEEARQTYQNLLAALPEAADAVSYERWWNAWWRHDLADMQAAQETLPQSIWAPSYRAVTEAVSDATRWPRAREMFDETERQARAAGRRDAVNYLRLLDPQADDALKFATMDASVRSEWGSQPLRLWMPQLRALRQTPAFQNYLKRNKIIDYWRKHGFPPQCKPDGDGARCE